MAGSEMSSGSSESTFLEWKGVSGGKKMDEENRDDKGSEMQDNETRRMMEEIEAHVGELESMDLIDVPTDIRSGLLYIQEKIADYLAQTVALRESLVKDGMEESTFREKVEEYFREQSFPVFEVSRCYLTQKRENLAEKRDEINRHMGMLYKRREDALAVMEVTYDAMREMRKEKPLLEARLAQKLDPVEREQVKDEYDLLKDSWFFEGEKLTESTYVVELASILLKSMEVYRANIDIFIAEVDDLDELIASLPGNVPEREETE